MAFHLSEGRVTLFYLPKFREYHIRHLDEEPVAQRIYFCPWCGAKLPDSLRDRYFDELDALGMASDDPNLPERYKSDEWYRKEEK